MNRCPSQLSRVQPLVSLSLSLTLYFLLFVLPPSIRVISPYFHRCLSSPPLPLCFICLCLSCNQLREWRPRSNAGPPPSNASPSSARLFCCVTFTDLHKPHKPSPPSCSLYPCFLCLHHPPSVVPTCLDQSSQTQTTGSNPVLSFIKLIDISFNLVHARHQSCSTPISFKVYLFIFL